MSWPDAYDVNAVTANTLKFSAAWARSFSSGRYASKDKVVLPVNRKFQPTPSKNSAIPNWCNSTPNRKAVGLPVTVFVSIRAGQHNEKWLQRFSALGCAMPEVQEFHCMSGDVDYLLKVVTTSIDGYDRFYKKLIGLAELGGVSSAFSMEQLKSTTALPLELF